LLHNFSIATPLASKIAPYKYTVKNGLSYNTPPLPGQHTYMGMYGCGMTIYGHVVMAMEGYYNNSSGYYLCTPRWMTRSTKLHPLQGVYCCSARKLCRESPDSLGDAIQSSAANQRDGLRDHPPSSQFLALTSKYRGPGRPGSCRTNITVLDSACTNLA
jgi:hypothetical protein